MNLTERIYGRFLDNATMEVNKGNCSKREFLENCGIAFGAFQLVVLSDIDANLAFRLVTRYWDYARDKSEHGSPLTVDEVVNAMTFLIEYESLEHLLEMPDKQFFLLITQLALDNITNVAEECNAWLCKEVADDE